MHHSLHLFRRIQLTAVRELKTISRSCTEQITTRFLRDSQKSEDLCECEIFAEQNRLPGAKITSLSRVAQYPKFFYDKHSCETASFSLTKAESDKNKVIISYA